MDFEATSKLICKSVSNWSFHYGYYRHSESCLIVEDRLASELICHLQQRQQL